MSARMLYSAPFFLAAMLIFIVALFAVSRRQARGAGYLVFLCLAAAYWAFTEGLLYQGLSIETAMRITRLQYLGIALLPPLALFFCLSVFGYGSWATGKYQLLLFGIAGLILLIVLSNPWHGMVFTRHYTIDHGPFPMLGLQHGTLWWFIIIYHYLLIAGVSLLLFHQLLTGTGFYRMQAGVILVGVIIVWLVNAIYVSGNSPVPNMDMGPIAFILVAGSMAWGFFRYSLLDILPIAKAEIFYGIKDAILVLDKQNRVLDFNPAATFLFETEPKTIIGSGIEDVCKAITQIDGWPELADVAELVLQQNGRERIYDLHTSTINDKRGVVMGRVLVFHDNTHRKHIEIALKESDRLRVILETTGAVCHEMNQPLMAISGYAELISMALSPQDPLYDKLQKLNAQVERLGDITRKLMSITRYRTKPYGNRHIVDIHQSTAGIKDR